MSSEIPSQIRDYVDKAVLNAPSGSWSFTQGFLLGQLTVLLIVFAFVKFMLFENVQNPTKKRIPLIPPPTSPKTITVPPASAILAKTLYDPLHHAPESVDWLNVLLAQAIQQYRTEAQTNNRLLRIVCEALNSGDQPDFVGPIEVTQLNLGEEYPMFNNARIRPSEQPGRMRVEVDCVFTDQITLGIDTHIFINWPKPKIAVLPISMVVSVVKFSATITLEIVNTHQSTSIATSALPDFALCFDVQSLIGSCSKLESVPKVTHILTSKLRNLFCEKFVYPNCFKFEIPDLLDAHKNDHEK